MITKSPTARPMIVHRDKLKLYYCETANPGSGLVKPNLNSANPTSGLDSSVLNPNQVLTNHDFNGLNNQPSESDLGATQLYAPPPDPTDELDLT